MRFMMMAGLMALALPTPHGTAAEPDLSSMTSEQRKAYFKEQLALKRIRDAHAAAAAKKPDDSRAAAFFNEKTTLDSGSLGPSGGLSTDAREKRHAITGVVTRAFKDGVLVRCGEAPGRTNGLPLARGLVMLRGVTAEVDSPVKTQGHIDGFYDFDADSGPRRVPAYRLAR